MGSLTSEGITTPTLTRGTIRGVPPVRLGKGISGPGLQTPCDNRCNQLQSALAWASPSTSSLSP